MIKEKILQLVGSPEGGMGTHIISISKYLCQEYEVCLAASMDKSDQKFDEQFRTLKPELFDVFTITINKKPSFGDLKNIYTLYHHYKDMGIKIIHGHGAKGGLYARSLGWFLGAKVIYSPHGGSFHSMHGRIMNLVYLWIEKILYIATDVIVLDSNYEKNIFLRKINRNLKKIYVNYNGVTLDDTVTGKPFVASDEIVIASFGILRHLKGHDLLIKAVAALIGKGYKIKLKIYGEGSERHNLELLIDDLKLQEQVCLCGFVDNSRSYMIESDMIVHPSRFDALPYVPIEAMNLMRPVVVSDAGGLTEIVQDHQNGRVFKSDNVEDLILVLEEMIVDVEHRSDMVDNAKRSIAENFESERVLSKLSAIYKGL